MMFIYNKSKQNVSNSIIIIRKRSTVKRRSRMIFNEVEILESLKRTNERGTKEKESKPQLRSKNSFSRNQSSKVRNIDNISTILVAPAIDKKNHFDKSDLNTKGVYKNIILATNSNAITSIFNQMLNAHVFLSLQELMITSSNIHCKTKYFMIDQRESTYQSQVKKEAMYSINPHFDSSSLEQDQESSIITFSNVFLYEVEI